MLYSYRYKKHYISGARESQYIYYHAPRERNNCLYQGINRKRRLTIRTYKKHIKCFFFKDSACVRDIVHYHCKRYANSKNRDSLEYGLVLCFHISRIEKINTYRYHNAVAYHRLNIYAQGSNKYLRGYNNTQSPAKGANVARYAQKAS